MNRKVRIGYFVSHPIPYQVSLLRLLAKQPELELRVFFFHQATAGRYHDPGFCQNITWDVPLLDGYSHETLTETKGLRGWHRDIERRIGNGEFDVVWLHGHNHPTFLRIIRAANQNGVKVLMRGDSNPLIVHPIAVRRFMREAWLSWCFRRCSAFLCIGKLNREFYLQRGVPDERLFEMPYAVDNEFFQKRAKLAHPRREALRNSLSIMPGRPIILFAGKLQEHKGAMDLLEAYARMCVKGKTTPHSCLLFAGSGPERVELEIKAKSTGLESIRFLGFQNQTQLPALFDLCDIFVLPSRREPWGLVVNEAMNAGKPVVVSDVSGCAPDLVSDDNGWIFRAGDVNALHKVLAEAVHDSKRLEAMGRNSLDRIGRYSYKQDIEGLMKATSWALGESSLQPHSTGLARGPSA